MVEINFCVNSYFVGLSATIETYVVPYGITTAETQGSICVSFFNHSKSTDYLRIFKQQDFGILLARMVILQHEIEAQFTHRFSLIQTIANLGTFKQ